MSKEQMLKLAARMLDNYEKADESRKPALAFYLRKMHEQLVNAEHTT